MRLIKESVASFTLRSPCWGSYIFILYIQYGYIYIYIRYILDIIPEL